MYAAVRHLDRPETEVLTARHAGEWRPVADEIIARAGAPDKAGTRPTLGPTVSKAAGLAFQLLLLGTVWCVLPCQCLCAPVFIARNLVLLNNS